MGQPRWTEIFKLGSLGHLNEMRPGFADWRRCFGRPPRLLCCAVSGLSYSARLPTSAGYGEARLPYHTFVPQSAGMPALDPGAPGRRSRPARCSTQQSIRSLQCAHRSHPLAAARQARAGRMLCLRVESPPAPSAAAADIVHITLRFDQPRKQQAGTVVEAGESEETQTTDFHLEVDWIKALPGGIEADFILVSCAGRRAGGLPVAHTAGSCRRRRCPWPDPRGTRPTSRGPGAPGAQIWTSWRRSACRRPSWPARRRCAAAAWAT